MAGVEVGTAYLTVVPSAKGFAGKLQSELGGGMASAGAKAGDTASKGFGSKFKSGVATAAKAGALGLAAVMALGVGFAKGAVAEARESQKVGAVTESIIKSTGGTAKVSAGQVGDLATALSNKTGIDDEVIQSGANMLLTFKNVRNEVGKGADIFDRANAAAVDLSAAGFGDVAGQSKMLGKALNDPIKGISALSRSGVTFTEQQKKQIKTLVASGKTLEAQKIILGEVESQVGGTAAASATMGEKVSVAWGNFKEGIGTSLLPVIDKAQQFITEKLLPGIQGVIDILFKGDFTGGFAKAFNLSEDSKIVDFLFDVREGAQQVFDILFKGDFKGGPFSEDSGIVDTLFSMREGFAAAKAAAAQFIGEFIRGEGAGGAFRDVLFTTGTALVAIAKFLGQNLEVVVPLVAAFGVAVGVIKTITAVTRAWMAVQAAMNVLLTANPIGLIIVALGLLVAGFVIAYKKSETFRNIVNRQLDLLKIGFFTLAGVAVQSFKFLLNIWLTVVGALVKGAAKAFGWVPGLGPKLRAAAGNVDAFKNSANSSLSKIERELKIQANTAKAQAAINELRRNAAKPVTIPVFLKTKYTAGTVNVAGLGAVNAGQRYRGGDVTANRPYWVGENPDGSLNRTSELFVPKQAGTIVPQSQMGSAPAAAAGDSTKVVRLEVDGRVLAEIVMDHAGNAIAGGRTVGPS